MCSCIEGTFQKGYYAKSDKNGNASPTHYHPVELEWRNADRTNYPKIGWQCDY